MFVRRDENEIFSLVGFISIVVAIVIAKIAKGILEKTKKYEKEVI